MQRQRNYRSNDEAPLPEASDLAFVGMDMRAPPLVRPGFVSAAKNMRLVEGVYESRLGLFSPAWTRYASDDWPYRASYLTDSDAAYSAAYATTYGTGVFADPGLEGDTWIVRVCATALVFTRETEIGRIVAFGPNLTVSGPVQIVQNFNELVIVRGDDDTSLVWSGSWTDVVEELVPDSIPSGYAAMPNAHYGLAWRERLILLADRDDLAVGKIGDNSLYDTDDLFFVNRGRGDRLRSAAPLGGQSLLVLKSQSLHVLTYAQDDLSDARLDAVPVDMQFDSPHTTVVADGKVWWLDRRGVRTAQVTAVNADNKVIVGVEIVSDLIAPLVRRINWKYAADFTAAVTEDRIFFAVALDTQTAPQTLLVWNRRDGGQWESYDQWDTDTLDDFSVLGFAPAIPWLNAPRLFAIASDGRQACLDYSLGEDIIGWDGSTPIRADIAATLTTRGYTAGTNDPKKFQRVQFQLETWNPTVTLSAVYDGPGESATLPAVTRDRTKYFSRAEDFNGTNLDGRFHDPKRQDYSVVLDTFTPASGYATWATGNSYVVGNNVFRPTTGRNYRCIANNTSAASNQPDERSDLWVDLGASDDSYTAWILSYSAAPGDIFNFGSRRYGCLVAHVTTNGNRPEDHAEYWEDLGVDSALAGTGVFLRPEFTAYHDSDPDRDGSLSVQEANYFEYLTSGTAGCYIADASSYSGFRPNGIPATGTFHTADLNQNGQFSAADIARVAVLVAAGDYHVDPTSVDGFAPGVGTNEGVRLEDHQTWVERRDLNATAVWCQLALNNATGSFRVRAVALESQSGPRSNLLHA